MHIQRILISMSPLSYYRYMIDLTLAPGGQQAFLEQQKKKEEEKKKLEEDKKKKCSEVNLYVS